MTRSWGLGTGFVLRHAGLPFDWLEALGAPAGVLDAAAQVLAAEDEVLAAAEQARLSPASVRAALEQADPGRLPRHPSAGWQDAVERWRAALDAYRSRFEAAEAEASEALAGLLSGDVLREAVFLSNPDVYRNMLEPFVAQPGPLNARRRRTRRQLYTYVQRFCAKNETVSFFGPMAYGQAVPGRGVQVRTDVPRRRRVFLSHWAGLEVARAIAADPQLRLVLPFRRTGAPAPTEPAPTEPAPADPSQVSAAALLGALEAGPLPLPRLAQAVGAELRQTALQARSLLAAGCVEFGLTPGPYELDPLGSILTGLAALPDDPAIRAWTARLTRLRDLLTGVQETGFPARTALVAELEAAFTEITGQPARRGAGAVYADRAVFYEECASPFAVTVGEQTLADWQQALTPALEVCVGQGATVQREATDRVRAVLAGPAVAGSAVASSAVASSAVASSAGAGAGGTDGERGRALALPLPEYAAALQPSFDPGGSTFAAAHAPTHPVERHAEVAAALRAVAADQPGDRYALLDLCLAVPPGAGPEGAQLVLARCHHHLLTPGWLGTLYRDVPGQPFGLDGIRWAAEHPDLVALDVGRRNKGYYRFPGRRIVLRRPSAQDAGDPQALWPAQVQVEITPDGVQALDEAGKPIRVYLPLSDYVDYPPFAALSDPQVLQVAFDRPAGTEAPAGTGTPAGTEAAGDLPRVEIGEVTYQRARWVLDPRQLTAGSAPARFLQLRRLAARPGIGRFVFCRSPQERKPYLLDLESVLAADLAGHLAGHLADGADAGRRRLTLEEMLPGPDQLWLRDELGRRYTCELRVQASGRDSSC